MQSADFDRDRSSISQQEIQKYIKNMLYEKQMKIADRITSSSVFSKLQDDATINGIQGSIRFDRPEDDTREGGLRTHQEADFLRVYPDGGYQYSGYTLAIVNGMATRSKYHEDVNYKDLDYIDTHFELRCMKTSTQLEHSLGLEVNEEGITTIDIQAFADPTVDEAINIFYGEEDQGALLVGMNTTYYLGPNKEVKKVINIPIDLFTENEYLEMEERLLKSGLNLVAIPSTFKDSDRKIYYVISEMLPRDYEYIAITLDILDRRTTQNLHIEGPNDTVI